jgi:hypothetical protein
MATTIGSDFIEAPGHQMSTRFAGSIHIASPGRTPKAS